MLKMFVFIDVWFVKQDIKKMVKYKYMQFFYGEFENKTNDNFFLPSGVGIRTPDFQ